MEEEEKSGLGVFQEGSDLCVFEHLLVAANRIKEKGNGSAEKETKMEREAWTKISYSKKSSVAWFESFSFTGGIALMRE